MVADIDAMKQALIGAVNDNAPVLRSAAGEQDANEGNRNAQ
jgi:hypothetical protein